MNAVIDAAKTAPAAIDPPPVVRTAAVLWLTAVAFGVLETVLMAGQILHEGSATFAGLLPQMGFRLVVFGVAVYLALRLRRGANWARWTIGVMLGVFGTLSLVIEPVQFLLAGGSIGEAVAGADAVWLAFAASRIAHLVAVLGAMALMFQPRANAYFRPALRSA